MRAGGDYLFCRVCMTNHGRDYGVCEVPIMDGFALFLFHRFQRIIKFQKNRTQNRPKTPISSIFFYWVCFFGFGTEQ